MSEELVGRIALLEQNCDENRAAIAGLVVLLEKATGTIERLEGAGKALAFSTAEDRMPITIKREGKSLWYRADRKDPNNIHHPIPGTCITGVFTSLEIKDGERDGEPTRTAILYMKCSHGVERVRMDGMLKPKTSVSFKFFLQGLAQVPDDRLNDELTYKVMEGTSALTVKVEILDPLTGMKFGKAENLTDEEKAEKLEADQKRWRDRGYWQQQLEVALQRINEKSKLKDSKPVAIEPIAQKPRPELHDMEMSERRKEVAAAMGSAKVSRDDAIAFVSRKFKKQQSIEMTFAELNDFIYWLNMVQIVHGEMDRIGFTFDQESEMVSQAGQLAKKKLESDRISALDTSDLEGAIAWLGQLPDKSAQKGVENESSL